MEHLFSLNLREGIKRTDKNLRIDANSLEAGTGPSVKGEGSERRGGLWSRASWLEKGY
jgi:hypothetical protein